MAYMLNVPEILDFAIFIEQSGYKFYVESMKKLGDSRIMELFQYLADEEFKHEHVFAGMKTSFGKVTAPESYEGEYQAYMRDFCKIHSLANPEALATKIDSTKTLAGALEVALGFEKDSIVFFTELRDVVGGDRSGTVDRVIREEMGHIRKILEFQKKLK